MNLSLHTTYTFSGGTPATDGAFEAFVAQVAEELGKIDRDDIDITATVTERRIVFTLFSEEDEPLTDDFLAAVRTALHAIPCGTAGWERMTGQRIEVHDGVLV